MAFGVFFHSTTPFDAYIVKDESEILTNQKGRHMSSKKRVTAPKTLDDLPDQEMKIILPISMSDLTVLQAVSKLRKSEPGKLLTAILIRDRVLETVISHLRAELVRLSQQSEAKTARDELIATLPQ